MGEAAGRGQSTRTISLDRAWPWAPSAELPPSRKETLNPQRFRQGRGCRWDHPLAQECTGERAQGGLREGLMAGDTGPPSPLGQAHSTSPVSRALVQGLSFSSLKPGPGTRPTLCPGGLHSQERPSSPFLSSGWSCLLTPQTCSAVVSFGMGVPGVVPGLSPSISVCPPSAPWGLLLAAYPGNCVWNGDQSFPQRLYLPSLILPLPSAYKGSLIPSSQGAVQRPPSSLIPETCMTSHTQ